MAHVDLDSARKNRHGWPQSPPCCIRYVWNVKYLVPFTIWPFVFVRLVDGPLRGHSSTLQGSGSLTTQEHAQEGGHCVKLAGARSGATAAQYTQRHIYTSKKPLHEKGKTRQARTRSNYAHRHRPGYVQSFFPFPPVSLSPLLFSDQPS